MGPGCHQKLKDYNTLCLRICSLLVVLRLPPPNISFHEPEFLSFNLSLLGWHGDLLTLFCLYVFSSYLVYKQPGGMGPRNPCLHDLKMGLSTLGAQALLLWPLTLSDLGHDLTVTWSKSLYYHYWCINWLIDDSHIILWWLQVRIC